MKKKPLIDRLLLQAGYRKLEPTIWIKSVGLGAVSTTVGETMIRMEYIFTDCRDEIKTWSKEISLLNDIQNIESLCYMEYLTIREGHSHQSNVKKLLPDLGITEIFES